MAVWRDALPAEIKDNPSLEKFGDVSDLAKSYIEVQKLVGADKVVVPGADAKPEDWAKVYDKLGRPAKPEEYGIENVLKDVKLPEGFAMQSEGLKEFSSIAHTLGLNKQQMAGLVKFYAESQGKSFQDIQEGFKKEQTEAEAALRKEWGSAFAEKVKLANKVLKVAAGADFDKIASAFGNNPVALKALAKLGDMISEDQLGEGEGHLTLTPEQAQQEISKINGDMKHPYWVAEHPEHAAAVDKMAALTKAAYPNG